MWMNRQGRQVKATATSTRVRQMTDEIQRTNVRMTYNLRRTDETHPGIVQIPFKVMVRSSKWHLKV